MRDIRKLQQPFTSKNQPAIIVRLYVILLNFDPLRAIILSDRMIVLVPSGADAILDQLSVLLHDVSQVKEEGIKEGGYGGDSSGEEDDIDDHQMRRMNAMNTFPFKAVESVISVVVKNMEDDLDDIGNRVGTVLAVLEVQRSKVSYETLASLKTLKNEVAGEEARAVMTRAALDEILSEDEDMALLGFATNIVSNHSHDIVPLLSHSPPFRRTVPLSLSDCTLISGSEPTHCIHIDEHEAFEILFENILQAVITVQTSIALLRTEIANGEQFHLLHLTTARNKLLSASVGFSIVSMFTALGSFVASVFGMNLTSGFESSEVAFDIVAWSSSVMIISLTLFVFIALRYTGVLYGSSHS